MLCMLRAQIGFGAPTQIAFLSLLRAVMDSEPPTLAAVLDVVRDVLRKHPLEYVYAASACGYIVVADRSCASSTLTLRSVREAAEAMLKLEEGTLNTKEYKREIKKLVAEFQEVRSYQTLVSLSRTSCTCCRQQSSRVWLQAILFSLILDHQWWKTSRKRQCQQRNERPRRRCASRRAVFKVVLTYCYARRLATRPILLRNANAALRSLTRTLTRFVLSPNSSSFTRAAN